MIIFSSGFSREPTMYCKIIGRVYREPLCKIPLMKLAGKNNRKRAKSCITIGCNSNFPKVCEEHLWWIRCPAVCLTRIEKLVPDIPPCL